MTADAQQRAAAWVGAELDDADVAALLSPVAVGPVRLSNRFVMSAMGTRFATPDGFITDRHVAYYGRRAAGGTAAIMVEGSSVDPEGTTYPGKPRLYDDRYISGLARVAEAIRAGGAVPGIQLMHAGRHTSPRTRTGPALSPSGGGSYAHAEQSRPMSDAEIEGVIKSFAGAARRARKAGFELIEIHAAHGYLIHDFLSPLSNKRSDRWGGSPAARAALLQAVTDAVRSAAPGAGVIVRLSSSEFNDAGIRVEDAVSNARWAAAAGADAVLVSGGNNESLEWVVPPVFVPLGVYIDNAARIRAALDIPVGVVGRISTPQIAAAAVARRAADLLFLGRALLADPDFINKVAHRDTLPIRPCIACNECLAQHVRDEPILCTVNPEAGREGVTEAATMRSSVHRILVIGAGPAGMLFASEAAARGHTVTLFERSDVVGGKLWLAAAAPYKTTEMLALRESLDRELELRGVDRRIGSGKPLTDVLVDVAPDLVVVASGATPAPYVGDGVGVTDAEAYLAGDETPPWTSVVILGAGDTACDAADRLAEAGVAVTMLARGDRIARGVEAISSRLLRRRLRGLGVQIHLRTRITAVQDGIVDFVDDKGRPTRITVDHVLHARGVRPSGPSLADSLETTARVLTIGDADRPGNFLTSMRSAWDLARSI